MNDLLTAVSSARTSEKSLKENISIVNARSIDSDSTHDHTGTAGDEKQNRNDRAAGKILRKVPSEIGSPGDFLDFLRSEPETNELLEALHRLAKQQSFPGHDFHIAAPGPVQAQIISTLINNIIPTYWWTIKHSSGCVHLITCLSNVGGFNAVIARLKHVVGGHPATVVEHGNTGQIISDLVEVALKLFEGEQTLLHIWQGLERCGLNDMKMQMCWKEYVSLIASGRVVSTTAQAEDALRKIVASHRTEAWLGNGVKYGRWLGTNIARMLSNETAAISAASQMLSRSLSIGYEQHLVGAFFTAIFHDRAGAAESMSMASRMLTILPLGSRRKFLEHTFRWLSVSAGHEIVGDGDRPSKSSQHASAIGALLFAICGNDNYQEQMVSFLSDAVLSASISFVVLRACVSALAERANEELPTLLENLITVFGNTLFIQHTPINQQEAHAKTILLTIGYVHRSNPMAALLSARSSHHLQGVSSRLDTSNSRARWLGMVVGTAVSSLVDKDSMKMKFGTDDMETDEAVWYLDLVKVDDQVGSLHDFGALIDTWEKRKATGVPPKPQSRSFVQQLPMLNGRPVFGPPRPPAQTEIIGARISEVIDGEDDDTVDLKPYAKPDSDAEDSEEDANLVHRDKIRPPVYIRELMGMLRDDKNPERFEMGIKHAAKLVRRKYNFGAEVKDHAEELGAILCNLQDPFSTDNFAELKLQASIAVLLSDTKTMAPWFSRQAFTGEYSIVQRCNMLSTLGLGGRELAGLQQDEQFNPKLMGVEFPSKRLPSRLDSIYSAESDIATKRLDAATDSMQQQLIQPMAVQAAERSTSHLNAVKVRTFSSRPSVERTKRKPAPNRLATIFSSAFFFPLANRYQQEIAAYGSSSAFSRVPIVLVTFLRTIALLFHAAGPATVDLPLVTTEMWDLLLSLRTRATQDITVMQAVLFSLLTVLEVNTDHRRIAHEHPQQLMQTQQWVDMVFDRTGGGGLISDNGDGDEIKVRTLAAGVLVKTKEIIEAYQRELIGYGA